MYEKWTMQKINEQMRINAQQRLLILLKIQLNEMRIKENNKKIARNNAIIVKLLAEEEAEKVNLSAIKLPSIRRYPAIESLSLCK